jgi:hypothetical protein
MSADSLSSFRAQHSWFRVFLGATKAPDYTFRIGRRVFVRARSMIDKHPRTVILT